MPESKFPSLESVKSKFDFKTQASQALRMEARSAWWGFCEASKADHLPTFREFWNDESTYENVL